MSSRSVEMIALGKRMVRDLVYNHCRVEKLDGAVPIRL